MLQKYCWRAQWYANHDKITLNVPGTHLKYKNRSCKHKASTVYTSEIYKMRELYGLKHAYS